MWLIFLLFHKPISAAGYTMMSAYSTHEAYHIYFRPCIPRMSAIIIDEVGCFFESIVISRMNVNDGTILYICSGRRCKAKRIQPNPDYICRSCLSSLYKADKSGLDRLRGDKWTTFTGCMHKYVSAKNLHSKTTIFIQILNAIDTN